MTPELIGILTVGVALAALILTSTGQLRNELGAQIAALDGRIVALDNRMVALESRMVALESRILALESRMGSLVQGMARLEGLLEGAGLYRPAAVPVPMPDAEAAPTAAGG